MYLHWIICPGTWTTCWRRSSGRSSSAGWAWRPAAASGWRCSFRDRHNFLGLTAHVDPRPAAAARSAAGRAHTGASFFDFFLFVLLLLLLLVLVLMLLLLLSVLVYLLLLMLVLFVIRNVTREAADSSANFAMIHSSFLDGRLKVIADRTKKFENCESREEAGLPQGVGREALEETAPEVTQALLDKPNIDQQWTIKVLS